MGSVRYDAGIISIERFNSDGKFELWLHKYEIDGVVHDAIPGNDTATGKRSFRVRAQAKVKGADHRLFVVFRGRDSWLASKQVTINLDSWTPIELYFRVPYEPCHLRIDDHATKAPSSVQLQHLELTERVA